MTTTDDETAPIPAALRGVGSLVAFAAAYILAAYVGRLTTFGDTPFALIWPAAGVAVAWFLVRGVGIASIDAVLLALLAFGSNASTGVSIDQSVVLAAANLLQTWAAVVLLRRWCGELWGCGGTRPLDSPRLTIRYVAALAAGMFVGVVVGVAGTFAIQNQLTLTRGVLWFDRNFCGAVAVTTLTLLLGQRWTSRDRRPLVGGGRADWIELVAVGALTVVTYGLAFGLDSLPMAFPLLLTTVWVGLRFATVLSVLHSLVVGAAAVVLTLGQYGPFAGLENEELGIVLAQFFLATLIISGLLLATGRDERVQLADELAAAREDAVYQAGVLDAVINSMAEGVAVVDDDGAFLLLNPAGRTVLGFDGKEPPATLDGLRDLYVDGHPIADTQRPSQRALRGEVLHDVAVELRTPGHERVLSISASPLPGDPRQTGARAVLLLRDATTEHAERQELAAFAGVVAHDLRNPLAAIDGWTELLDEAADAGELKPQVVQEFLARVRTSSTRMHGLILHLLAHATSKNRSLSLTQLDLAEAATRVAAARDATDFVTVGPIPPVHGDRVLVDQVLENLIGNALKYVAAGVRPCVEVGGRLEGPPDGQMVRVCVADNGIGLPEGEHDSVFKEFHRAHTTGYEGTGLGLAIARRIVTRHGGTILARDNPSGGTIFEFTLPAAV